MTLLVGTINCECRSRAGKRSRSGSVGLMLILVLALLIGTFAASVSRRMSSERRSELHHQSIAVLHSAIEAVAESGITSGTKVRLPLDESLGRWVIVESVTGPRVMGPSEESQYQATLYHNDRPGLSIRRPASHDR